jgi:ABC-type Mn2+/Zn2+ transport system permease subunit
LLLGAALSAGLGALFILAVVGGTRVKQDAALGIVLSVFFGAGIVLLTLIAGSGDAGQSGLDRFIFGQAATIVRADVVTMGLLAAAAVVLLALFFKEFKLLSFDPAFAASLGFPVRALNVLLTALIVVAVVVGIQAVGVVLMAAMLITPAAAARTVDGPALGHGPSLGRFRCRERGLRRPHQRLRLQSADRTPDRASRDRRPSSSPYCWAAATASSGPGSPDGATAGRPCEGGCRLSPDLVVVVTAVLVAVPCALLGTFLVLRQMSMMGDAISHAVLPGIVVAFFLSESLGPLTSLLGAGAFGLLTAALVEALKNTGRVKEDASIGIVFTALFALGVFLISRFASDVHLDLQHVLYGEIAFSPLNALIVGSMNLGPRSFWTMGIVTAMALGVVLLLYKELKIATFDAGPGRRRGALAGARPLPAHGGGLRDDRGRVSTPSEPCWWWRS